MIIIMVGYPGRGKTYKFSLFCTISYIAYKLQRYLSWLGYHAKVFSISEARQKHPEYVKVPLNYWDPNIKEVLIVSVMNSIMQKEENFVLNPVIV